MLYGAEVAVCSEINTVWAECTGRFITLSVITNIYNKQTKGPT